MARTKGRFASPTMLPWRGGAVPPARTCQFLEGDPAERGFCGKPTARGSYCAEHYDRCHVPAEDRRKRRKAARSIAAARAS